MNSWKRFCTKIPIRRPAFPFICFLAPWPAPPASWYQIRLTSPRFAFRRLISPGGQLVSGVSFCRSSGPKVTTPVTSNPAASWYRVQGSRGWRRGSGRDYVWRYQAALWPSSAMKSWRSCRWSRSTLLSYNNHYDCLRAGFVTPSWLQRNQSPDTCSGGRRSPEEKEGIGMSYGPLCRRRSHRS